MEVKVSIPPINMNGISYNFGWKSDTLRLSTTTDGNGGRGEIVSLSTTTTGRVLNSVSCMTNFWNEIKLPRYSSEHERSLALVTLINHNH